MGCPWQDPLCIYLFISQMGISIKQQLLLWLLWLPNRFPKYSGFIKWQYLFCNEARTPHTPWGYLKVSLMYGYWWDCKSGLTHPWPLEWPGLPHTGCLGSRGAFWEVNPLYDPALEVTWHHFYWLEQSQTLSRFKQKEYRWGMYWWEMEGSGRHAESNTTLTILRKNSLPPQLPLSQCPPPVTTSQGSHGLAYVPTTRPAVQLCLWKAKLPSSWCGTTTAGACPRGSWSHH